MRMMKLSLIAVVLSMLGCCPTDESRSREVLSKQGFTDVRFTGYVWFACSEDDAYHTGFIAKNPQGNDVQGVVCCGFLKSCTIRW